MKVMTLDGNASERYSNFFGFVYEIVNSMTSRTHHHSKQTTVRRRSNAIGIGFCELWQVLHSRFMERYLL